MIDQARWILEQVQEAQAAPPGGTFKNDHAVPFTASDVSLMVSGDLLIVAALGIGGAAARGCSVTDQAILQWQRPSGGDPLLKVRP